MEFPMKLTIFLACLTSAMAMDNVTTRHGPEFAMGAGIQVTLQDFHPDKLFDHIPRKGRNKPRAFVNAHNAARLAVGVPPLVWDDTLTTYARNYANQRVTDCAMEHSMGSYGENLAAGSWDLTAKEAVSMWVDEQKFFVLDPSACMNSGDCLHYTQVVWNSTESVGCARARCLNGWTFVTCNYYPPGNYIGEMPFSQGSFVGKWGI